MSKKHLHIDTAADSVSTPRDSPSKKKEEIKRKSFSSWQFVAVGMAVVFIPWALYVNYHPRLNGGTLNDNTKDMDLSPVSGTKHQQLNGPRRPSLDAASMEVQADSNNSNDPTENANEVALESMDETAQHNLIKNQKKIQDPELAQDEAKALKQEMKKKRKKHKGPADPIDKNALSQLLSDRPIGEGKNRLPVLGPLPTGGVKPLYGFKHAGGDAIFALACNYPKQFYQRFVGSLRKSKFTGDIVLAVSPPVKMKAGVEAYIKETKVIAYGFDVDCAGIDDCKLKDDFLGYPDPRPYRTFAMIRYALYEYWLQYYSERSYILILDFRDTFFQVDPFLSFGPIESRNTTTYDLQLYAENWQVKTIGKCVFNSLWIGRCFGKPALRSLLNESVICSGSTLGSYLGITHYVRTMLKTMDSVQCWLRGIESDQGYQNFLFYNGYFSSPDVKNQKKAVLFQQGEGVVNTIGAMNGFRVPAHLKGTLTDHWKIRDEEGRILNNDGTLSPCVHQWDRWYAELHKHVDKKTY